MELHEILVQIRENHFDTQEQTADILGITQATYSDYETNNIHVPLDKLCKFAVAYKTRLDYILGLSKDKVPLSKMKPFDIKIFAKNLRILRKNNNYTQKSLGIKVSCSESTINKHENAKSLMSYNLLINLSKLYNVPTDIIVGIVQSPDETK